MEDNRYEGLKLEYQLCFPLYAASREVIKQYHPFLDPLGLTYTQYIVMMVLWQEQDISVKELGKKLFLDSGTLTPVVKALEKQGYVQKHRDVNDERIVLVTVTEKGYELREKCLDIPSCVGKSMKLDPEDAVKLYELLYKVLGSIN